MRRTGGKLSRVIAAGMVAAMALGNVMINPLVAGRSLAAGGVAINEANFPDPNFRRVIAGSDYDRNGDGYLDNEEIGLTLNIYCDKEGIKSLEGAEVFTDLQGLYCMDNELETLDISCFSDLRGVWCSGNKLTSLDLTHNSKLVWVYCFDNNISELDVSKNPDMAYLEINTNPIKELDVTHNPELEHLTCGTCELKELDISKNPKLSHLDAFSNHITKLDVSKNPKMKRLDIWNNPGLGSIDISNNPGIQYYNCAYNGATSIDVSKQPELTKLICSYNNLTSLDVTNNPKLVYLDCALNSLPSLDISKNPYLNFLQAFTNDFTTLDISNNPFLVKAYKEGEKKAEYDVCQGHSWTIEFGGEVSTGLDNMYFLCFDDKVTLNTEGKGGAATDVGNDVGNMDNVTVTADMVTREMAAQILYELAGSPSVAGQSTRFTDVEAGSWYEAAVIWGEKNNICIGYPYVSADTFGVGIALSRQDMAFMLMRYSELLGYKRSIDFGRSDEYQDYYEIDYYAWEAICWAATLEILEGKGAPGAPKSEQKIDPHGTVSRSDFKTVYKNMMEVNNIEISATINSTLDKLDTFTAAKAIVGQKDSWVQSNGNYYYYDKKGRKETDCYREGYWMNSDGTLNETYCHGTWKSDDKGWWYEDDGWYPTSQWLKIDGYWYYFLEDGYMDYSEYRDGCWLNADGSCDENYCSGEWHSDSVGWWFTDGDWYPVSQYLWINGYNYYFDGSGYWTE